MASEKCNLFSLKLLRLAFFACVALCALRQPVFAYVTDAQQRVIPPFDAAYIYDVKYLPSDMSAYTSAQQANDDDEIGNNNYDTNEHVENGLGYLTSNNDKRSSKIHVYRRSCVRRNGGCDNRPKDCCYNSSCRCNLWGSNCRCQRMGLFQKWG